MLFSSPSNLPPVLFSLSASKGVLSQNPSARFYTKKIVGNGDFEDASNWEVYGVGEGEEAGEGAAAPVEYLDGYGDDQ